MIEDQPTSYKSKRAEFDDLRAQNNYIELNCLKAGLSLSEIPEDVRGLYFENEARMKALMPRVWGGSLYLNKGMGGVRR